MRDIRHRLDVKIAVDRIRMTCATERELLQVLDRALLIAQCGGVSAEMLEALLELAAHRRMTPHVEQRLGQVGISTSPWSATSGVCVLVPAGASESSGGAS